MSDGPAKKRKGFVRFPNAAAQDKRLSFRARGVLAYVLSRPKSWKHRAETIQEWGTEGRDAIRTALNELEEKGYYRIRKAQTEDGRWESVAEFSEDGFSVVGTEDGKSGVGKPARENRPSVSQALSDPRQTDKTDGAATAAPISKPEIPGSVARAGAGAPDAPLPDGQWLATMLSPFELEQVRVGLPALRPLTLWQVAEVYHAFQAYKRGWMDDVKKARKLAPGLTPAEWFGQEVGARKDWKAVVEKWKGINSVKTRLGMFEDQVEKLQRPQPEPQGWEYDYFEHLFQRRFDRGQKLPDWVWDKHPGGWEYVTPIWLQSLLAGAYIPLGTPK